LFIHRSIERDGQLSFIDLERGGFGEILPEVMIFPERLCPEGNITEGNISPNHRISHVYKLYIIYRKLKASKLRIKNLTHTFVNTIFYFWINASIRRFSFESHIVWNINDNIFQNFEKAPLRLKFDYSSLINTIYILIVGHVVVMRVLSHDLRE
jgi:hypothetical protein